MNQRPRPGGLDYLLLAATLIVAATPILSMIYGVRVPFGPIVQALPLVVLVVVVLRALFRLEHIDFRLSGARWFSIWLCIGTLSAFVSTLVLVAMPGPVNFGLDLEFRFARWTAALPAIPMLVALAALLFATLALFFGWHLGPTRKATPANPSDIPDAELEALAALEAAEIAAKAGPDPRFDGLRTYLNTVPATKVLSDGGSGERWWVKLAIDIHHPLAWHVVQELGHVLNEVSISERLPTVFKPVSPPPYLNGGPTDFLSWVIECPTDTFSPDNAKDWLEGRLPRPVTDLTQWPDPEE